MGLLLYKSNEMFSSTELIRKSKMIFDKVLDNEIEKAIILRDGKPSFLLMEFSKYEKIMAEYEELKEYVESLESGDEIKVKKTKKKKKKADIELKKELEAEAKVLSMDGGDYSDLKKQKELPKKEPETKPEVKEVVSNPQSTQTTNVVKEPSEAEEIQQAIASIDAMDHLDEETKQKGREKIRQKIIEARKQREAEAKAREQNLQEEDKEFEEQLQYVQEEKLKKEQELEEFWD